MDNNCICIEKGHFLDNKQYLKVYKFKIYCNKCKNEVKRCWYCKLLYNINRFKYLNIAGKANKCYKCDNL